MSLTVGSIALKNERPSDRTLGTAAGPGGKAVGAPWGCLRRNSRCAALGTEARKGGSGAESVPSAGLGGLGGPSPSGGDEGPGRGGHGAGLTFVFWELEP